MGKFSTNGYPKQPDPETRQSFAHFFMMRAEQHMHQPRDYKRLREFVGFEVLTSDRGNTLGIRTAPVAVFKDTFGQEVAIHTRNLRRMFRLAKADAKYERKRRLIAPGPASVFLEIARQPFEKMMAHNRTPTSPDIRQP